MENEEPVINPVYESSYIFCPKCERRKHKILYAKQSAICTPCKEYKKEVIED
jgi:hypothetical protein